MMRRLGLVALACAFVAGSTQAGTGVAQGASLASAQPGAGRVLVVPFENVNREGRLYWLTEASAILLTQNLVAAGQNVISRDERVRAFERLQLPRVASLTEATVIRVGQLVGATSVVLGSFSLEGDNLQVKAKTVRLDTGRVGADLVRGGKLDDLFSVYDAIADGLAGGAAVSRAPHQPLPVFENYVKGLLAETAAAQVRFLETALRLSPRFDAARIGLWQVYSAQGDHTRAAAAALAIPPTSPLGRRARFLAALSRIRLHQYDEAFQALKALLDEAPGASIYNNMGVVQLRRGPNPQGGPTYYFNRAAEAEPDPDYAFNLGYAYWFGRDAKAASYWLHEAVRRNPADGDAHYVLGVALQATGAQVEGEREKELARQLSSKYSEWERRPASGDPVPRGLERVREELDTPRLSLVDATLGPGERKDQEQMAAYHLDRGRRLFEQQQDREAMDELNRSLYILPYQAQAHLLLGRIHLRAGRLSEAVEELKISLWCQDTVAGHVTLGEVYLQAKDAALAASEADKALALNPQSPETREEGRGKRDEGRGKRDEGRGIPRPWSPFPRPYSIIVPGRCHMSQSARRRRRALTLALPFLLWLLALPLLIPIQAQSPRPLVLSAVVDALIQPVSAEFMVETMDRAARERAELVVFTLRTPGGLLDSTRVIVQHMLASKVPVAVFVGPAGSRAASAGFLVTIAADVAAMAPGTHIGAAHPVQGSGEKLDETMAKKMASDVAADARTWATRRGRNAQLADEAVRESRSFTEQEALSAVPPLIDAVATDVTDLMKKLDGRTVTRFDGSTVVLHTASARVQTIEMDWRQRLLSALAHPNIAYLLLSLGMLGLTIELWNPGAVLPGVAGGLCLLLAFFTFQVLPVNYAGVLLILFGVALLILEVKVTSHGVLSAGGIASLLFGSLILMDSSAPELAVSLSVIIPVVAALSAILIVLVRLGIASQRRQPITGTAGMIGEPGRVLEAIAPGIPGRVETHGEIWRARADVSIPEGARVRVTAVDGLTVTVEQTQN